VNIILRTAHIGVVGVLLGGHVFDVSRERLHVWIAWSIATGSALILAETYPRLRWFYEVRGVMTLVKLLLLCLIPSFWSYRVWLLAAVVVLASVGSHMPARFRYFSLLHGRMMEDSHRPASPR
jgi:hypothetical protein